MAYRFCRWYFITLAQNRVMPPLSELFVSVFLLCAGAFVLPAPLRQRGGMSSDIGTPRPNGD